MKRTLFYLMVLFYARINIIKCQTVETRIFHQIQPSTSNINFGASMSVTSVDGQYTVTSGAPAHGNPQGPGGRRPQGGVFTCSYRSQTSGTTTCDTVQTFSQSGGVGISMEVEADLRNNIICGNTFSYDCPNSTYEQHMIGACYKQSISGDANPVQLLTPCPIACPGTVVADIMFVMDESSSVNLQEFNQEKSWIIEVLTLFRSAIDAGYVNVGVTTFSRVPRIRIRLSSTTFEDLTRQITNIRDRGTGTFIRRAIENTTAEFELYGRPRVTKQMILVTDGRSQGDSILPAANAARDLGIITVAVGVGDGIAQNQLLEVAGSQNQVFEASDFTDLSSVINDLRQVIIGSGDVGLEGAISNSTNSLSQCQLGTSSFISKTGNFYTGAIGAYDRAGSLVDYISRENSLSVPISYTNVLDAQQLNDIPNVDQSSNPRETYLGYSVASGNFFGGDIEYIASGSPRYESRGRVLIYRQDFPSDSPLSIIKPKSDLWQLGAYFGQSLLSVDLNGDSYDDLMISSPLFSDIAGYDQGRVFVFLSNPNNPAVWDDSYSPQILSGSNTFGARFGMSITVVGDVDLNGYADIVVGAPREDLSENGSGAVYLYYISASGINEQKYQRILGSTITSDLQHFGYAVAKGTFNNTDVDFNGYPDIVSSAPSSDSVIVLRSRPILDVEAEIQTSESTIPVSFCLSNSLEPCTTFRVCLLVRNRVEDINDEYRMDTILSLDSLVAQQSLKRLQFFDTSLSSISLVRTATSTRRCLTYSIGLQEDAFYFLENSLELVATLRFEFDLTNRHKNQVLSPVLDPLALNYVEANYTFTQGCSGSNGQCIHDLSADATFTIPPSLDTLIIRSIPPTFMVNVVIRNSGIDHSYFTKVNVTSGELILQKVTGDCVSQSQRESSPGVTVLFYRTPGQSSTGSLMTAGSSCSFTLEFSLASLTATATSKEIQINGRIFSNSGSESATADPNPDNNFFQYRRQVRYATNLVFGGSSSPIAIIYNRTTTPNFVRSLIDPVLGDNLTTILHNYTIENRGPNLISTAPLTFSWPEYTMQRYPLLYLYQFNCIPESRCRCEITDQVNLFNIPLDDDGGTGRNFTIAFPPVGSINLPRVTTCDDVICRTISCNIEILQAFQNVTILAYFKLWLPSLAQENLATFLSSNLDVDTSSLPLSPPGELRKTTAEFSIAEFDALFISNVTPGSNLGVIIGSIIGGILLLIILAVVLWKIGFFNSKYADKKKLAQEEADATPNENLSASAENLIQT